MLGDLRYAARMLAKSPGFTVVAVLSLALGMGANTAIFSVVNSVLLDGLPFRDAGRLALLYERSPREDENDVGAATFLDWRGRVRSFEGLAAWTVLDYAVSGDAEPQSVLSARVSAGLFGVLGVAPALGRGFDPQEEQLGRERVVVLSHGLWSQRFGADPAVIGRGLRLDGEPYTIVGVMPRGFAFPDQTARLWTPLAFKPAETAYRTRRQFSVIGRLAPGATVAQADAELDGIARGLAAQYPDSHRGWSASVVPAHQVVVGSSRRPLLVLLGAVGFVLLIACANVGSLLLARANARQREIAVRVALGASRGRLLRQLLVESLLLATAGGGLGALLAVWSEELLAALLPEHWPRFGSLGVNATVLGFTAALALATTLAAGLAPALEACRAPLGASLKTEGGRATATAGQRRLRRLLVVSEVALAVVLLVGAGLMVRTLYRLQRVDPGFDPERLLAATLYLPDNRYPRDPQQTAFFSDLLGRVRSLPGVVAAGAVTTLPMSRVGIDHDVPVGVVGRVLSDDQGPQADLRIASPGYFGALGVPLLRGRDFTEADREQAPLVAIVNRTFADRLLPGEDPVGQQVRWGRSGRVVQIVGVVGAVRHRGLADRPRPELYVPYRQLQYGSMTLVVRTAGDPAAVAAALKDQVYALDPGQPLTALATMNTLLADSVAGRRSQMLLLGAFAALALALAAVGIYGVVSHAVGQRTREIGIRIALGARAWDVLRLVLHDGLGLVSLGLGLGLAAALGLAGALDDLLFDVSPRDPLTLAAVAALLLGVALAACGLPARRASRVDPVRALRYE
jgi:putative ABC transport system permease protein